MYNRYIPQETGYDPLPRQEARPGFRGKGLGELLGGLLHREHTQSGGGKGLSSLLDALGLKELDAGDVLLALVVLVLILEDGDELEALIALALALLLHLGEP